MSADTTAFVLAELHLACLAKLDEEIAELRESREHWRKLRELYAPGWVEDTRRR